LELWPLNLIDFLERRLRTFFKVKAYLLDPAKVEEPTDGVARMQALSDDAEPIEGNPLDCY
jgi:hypothetical protein